MSGLFIAKHQTLDVLSLTYLEVEISAMESPIPHFLALVVNDRHPKAIIIIPATVINILYGGINCEGIEIIPFEKSIKIAV